MTKVMNLNNTQTLKTQNNIDPADFYNLQDLQLDTSWENMLRSDLQKDYMLELNSFLKNEFNQKKIIYPKLPHIFNALNSTPFENIKVVILGQDPYHGPNQAHGFCFSVLKGIPPPPSLVNIFKELSTDLKLPKPSHGDLTSWARQGVLLLNATLTVEAEKAGSHQNKGWENFTDKIIHHINNKRENIVFLLWGSFAQKKAAFIDRKKHFILEAPHPSPLSAYRGFLGCQHFSKTNDYLKSKNILPIDWRIP